MELTAQFMILCLCLLSGIIVGDGKGPGVVRVVVEEDSDVVLPCSLSSKENIVDKLFDWIKDGQKKKVFFYDAGIHSNNGVPGRVSHFSDQLKNGNASIKIRDTTISDSGNYTCDFPRLQPRQTFYIELVVEAPKPSIRIVNPTEYGVQLQCEVKGASPKPKVEWKDRAGNILPAEEPQVSDRGGRYYVTLLTTVTKTDHYHCVVTQEEIHHQTDSETYVFINEKLREESSRKELIGGLFGGLVLGALIVLVFLRVKKCIKRRCIKESHQGEPEESVKLQNNNQSGEIGVQFDPCESFSLMESHQRETEMPNTLQNESDCEKTDQQDDGCEEESSMLSESHQRETEMPNTLQNDNQSGEIYPKNAENEKKISMPSGE